jgi:hypothetical protein
MNVNPRWNFAADRGDLQKVPRLFWKRAPAKVGVHFIRKHENGSTGHTSGYERPMGPDKHFSAVVGQARGGSGKNLPGLNACTLLQA